MNIITIFNYPKNNDNWTKMCAIWLHQIKKHGKGFNVKIFTEHGVNEHLEHLIKTFGFTLYTLTRKQLGHSIEKFSHNIGFKLYNLCRETEPFIFIDADAVVLKDLNILKNLSENQRIVMINHEKIPGHTTQFPYKFLNSGVQVCNDPTILDFKAITQCKMIVPGTDQALLNSYFKKINYDYTHPNIGFEWNSYSRYVTLTHKKEEWEGVSEGLDYKHPVYINHYWFDAKPWKINCKLFEEYEKQHKTFLV